MGMPQSWNRYSYVMGNPYKYVDPGGDQWFKVEGQWTFIPDTTVIESVTTKLKGKDEGKTEVIQGREDFVGFDGGQLTIYRKDGSRQDFNAVSGRGGRTQPKLQSVSGVGPIPEGRYSFNTANVQNFQDLSFAQQLGSLVPPQLKKVGQWPGGLAAWGNQRVELVPDSTTNTYGRGGFFIHGGFTPGSAGCIDLCGRDTDFFSAVGGAGSVSVEVDYP